MGLTKIKMNPSKTFCSAKNLPLSGLCSAGPLPTSVTESSVPEFGPALSEPNNISSGPKGLGFSSSFPEQKKIDEI